MKAPYMASDVYGIGTKPGNTSDEPDNRLLACHIRLYRNTKQKWATNFKPVACLYLTR